MSTRAENPTVAAAVLRGHLLHHPGGRLDHAGEHDADRVADSRSGALTGGGGWRTVDDEFRDGRDAACDRLTQRRTS